MADISAFKFGKNPPFDLLSKKEVFYRNDKEYIIYTRQKFLKQVFEEVISTSLFTKSSHTKPKEIEVAKELDGRELEEAERTLLKIREKFDFFKNMDDCDVLSVTKDVHILKLSKNEMLFEQDSEGEDVFFIMRGFILISVEGKDSERVDLARLGQQNIFGEMAPITKERRSARATSLSDGTTILSFKIADDRDSDENVKSFKTLYQNFTHILAKKLVNANKIIAKRRG